MNYVRRKCSAQKRKKNTKEKHLEKVSKKSIENLPQKSTEEKEKPLQWHPAFFAEMQIELCEETENLIFENEHQLGTKPKEIDILIIKKNSDIPVKKNIGRIFRKYNIIEYKSPEDSLTINDFYKVLGYTYFYKADTKMQNEIKMEELTVTFVSRKFPRELFGHLSVKGMAPQKAEAGIWYLKYKELELQFIVTAQLSEENFWLKNLTNDLQDKTTVNKLIERYREHKDDIHYSSVMDVIMHANKEFFYKEDEKMCQAMMEILQDRIDEMVDKSREDGIRIGERNGEEKGILLAKQVLRMNADGADYETIALKCMITVDEVEDILSY